MVWPGFSSAEKVEINWIASRSGDKARAFSEEHGIANWTDDYAELITAKDVDAVFVGVPNHLHEEMAIAALANGKHVLQEKPMALTTEKAVAQAEVARHKGLVLMVNQESRLANGIRDLPGIIHTRLGSVRKIVLGMTLKESSWSGWRDDKDLSGGTLFEMAIHQLDLARWLFGKNPHAVWATGRDSPGCDMTVVMDFGGGDSALIDYCWRSIGFRLRIEAYCERGYIRQEIDLPFGGGKQMITTDQGEESKSFAAKLQGPETFRRVMEGFAGAILNGSRPPIPANDGVWAVRMAELARESLTTGETISFQRAQ